MVSSGRLHGSLTTRDQGGAVRTGKAIDVQGIDHAPNFGQVKIPPLVSGCADPLELGRKGLMNDIFVPLVNHWLASRSMTGGGWGCHKFAPVLGGDGTKIVRPGDIFDQPPGEMSRTRGKLANHVGDHVILSPEGVVLVTYLRDGIVVSTPSPIVERLWPMFSRRS